MVNIRNYIEDNKITRSLITSTKLHSWLYDYIKANYDEVFETLLEDIDDMMTHAGDKNPYKGEEIKFHVKNHNILGCSVFNTMIEMEPLTEEILNDIRHGNFKKDNGFFSNVKLFFYDIMLCFFEHHINADYYEQKAEVAEIKRKLGEI